MMEVCRLLNGRARSRRRSIPVLIAVLLLSLLATGCWPLPPDESGNGAQPASPGATGTPLAPGPQAQEGVLNIAGQSNDPPTLDPALASDTYSLFFVRQLFSGLLKFDDSLKIVPDLATGMPSVSQDGKTYTFSIRRGIKFTNGEQLTSADLKYSFERATDPKLAGAQPATELPAALYLDDIVGVMDKLQGKAKDVSGITAPDPYTLQITIDAPKSYFLSKLAAGPGFAVQRANVETGDRWTEDPRGTGPFKLQRWVHNQEIVLARNSDYFGGAPALDQVNVWMGANSQGQLDQYVRENSALDIATLATAELDRISDRNSPLARELQAVPELSTTYLGFNVRTKPFDDPKIREAIARVIDRQKIAWVMFQSRYRQATSFVPPGIAGYTPPEVDQGYDVTRARELIAESSYKDLKNLPRLRLYTAGDPMGPMLKDVLSQTLGIDLEVHEVEWTDYLAGLQRGDYPMFIETWAVDFPDPESVLGSLFRSASPANFTGYRNEDVDSALAEAALENDQGKRMSIYARVEQRVLSDFTAVPLVHPVTYMLIKPYVHDLGITPLGILSLKNVRLGSR